MRTIIVALIIISVSLGSPNQCGRQAIFEGRDACLRAWYPFIDACALLASWNIKFWGLHCLQCFQLHTYAHTILHTHVHVPQAASRQWSCDHTQLLCEVESKGRSLGYWRWLQAPVGVALKEGHRWESTVEKKRILIVKSEVLYRDREILREDIFQDTRCKYSTFVVKSLCANFVIELSITKILLTKVVCVCICIHTLCSRQASFESIS